MNRLVFIAIPLLLASLLIACKREQNSAAAAEATTQQVNPVEISLGTVNRGNGLRTLTTGDGRGTVANIGGSVCRTSKANRGGHAYLYFAIDPKIKSPRDAGALRNGKVTVEYFDSAKGELRMQYDGSKLRDDGHGAYSGSTAVIKTSGSGQWKTADFPFKDALFKNRQNANADFRLEAKKADLYVRKVTLLRD